MPKLPSGKVLELSRDTIVENDGTLFRCPDGYFWYQTPDLAFNTPPFQEGQALTMDLAHAPVPATREEAKKYIRVLFATDDGGWHWRGDLLSDFPRPGDLSKRERAAWRTWLAGEGGLCFLDETIELCRRQAEANRANTASMEIVPLVPEPSLPSESAAAFRPIVRRLLRLYREGEGARRSGNTERRFAALVEMEELLDKVRDLRSSLGRSHAPAAHAEGLALRVLERWQLAEVRFRECLRYDPFHGPAWLELVWCLNELGRHEEAEVAARRTVRLLPNELASWHSLANTLCCLGRIEEGNEVCQNTPKNTDPNDPVLRHIHEYFDSCTQLKTFMRGKDWPCSEP
jgi:tetratricopeptide (TPR) repeat protein